MKDCLLELRISALKRLLNFSHSVRSWAQARLFALINERSPRVVARMEKERGLS